MVAWMAGPREVRGTAAAPGRALGPAFHAPEPPAPPAPGARDGGAALERAMEIALGELRALAVGADASGIGVLDFQIEMLLDEEMRGPAFARIARGEGAALAWAGAVSAHIDAFTAGGGAGDDAFAARASDLADLRQRVLDALAGRARADFPDGAIYLGRDMPPSLFLAHDWSRGGGIALTAGSAVSHVAMLARARGVPMVIGLGALAVPDGQTLLVDGGEGVVRLEQPSTSQAFTLPTAPAIRPGGDALHAVSAGRASMRAARFRLSVNINSLSDLDAVTPAAVDGVGLVRTEFLFSSVAEALNEERHVEAYSRILVHFAGRPVTLRMLDLGGDKGMPGLVEAGSASPLGERGIRFLLAHPDLARLQARAMLRAAALGEVRVLLPMVTVPDELAAMGRLFDEEARRLDRLGIPARRPPLGIMVEVPAVALTLDLFADAAFFSVGTNDLMQYLSAAARDNPVVAPLHAGSEIALFRLMAQIATAAHQLGTPVSVCGDLAGAPEGLARLVALGLCDVSVAPSCLPAIGLWMEAAGALRKPGED